MSGRADELVVDEWGAQFQAGANDPVHLPRVVAPRSIKELLQFYRMSAIQRMAVDAIHTSLLRDEIVWCGADGEVLEPQQAVPHNVYFVMSEATRVLTQLGFVIWRVHKDGRIEIASPEDMTLQFDGSEWVPTMAVGQSEKSDGWCVSFTDAPIPPPRGVTFAGQTGQLTVSMLRSGCARSYSECLRAITIEQQWMHRDLHNSRPACFSLINPLSYSGGFDRQTYGNDSERLKGRPETTAYQMLFNSNASGAAGNNQFHTADADFNAAIKVRAERIALMEDVRETETNSAAFAPSALANPDKSGKEHIEHRASDLADIKETKTLLSQNDHGVFYQRCRYNALLACGVPPQALGESVNTERTGANHMQYERAMQLFRGTLAKYRRALSDILAGGRGDVQLRLSRRYTMHEVDRVARYMTLDGAARAIAAAYEMPLSSVDPARVAAVIDAAPTAAPGRPASQRTIANALSGGEAA